MKRVFELKMEEDDQACCNTYAGSFADGARDGWRSAIRFIAVLFVLWLIWTVFSMFT